MPVHLLDDRLIFPPVEEAVDGLVAVGGDLSGERLELAYRSGIFPWYSEGQPILWHSPDPRMVLAPRDLHVPRRLEKTIARKVFHVTADRAFREVIEACAAADRPGESGTWITPAMIEAYTELHRRGLAHSVEAWQGETLAGGLYGVSLGRAFFGESMFTRVSEASKVCFVRLVERLVRWDFTLIDCQVYTENTARFGAAPWPRERFLAALREALDQPTRKGPWKL